MWHDGGEAVDGEEGGHDDLTVMMGMRAISRIRMDMMLTMLMTDQHGQEEEHDDDG